MGLKFVTQHSPKSPPAAIVSSQMFTDCCEKKRGGYTVQNMAVLTFFSCVAVITLRIAVYFSKNGTFLLKSRAKSLALLPSPHYTIDSCKSPDAISPPITFTHDQVQRKMKKNSTQASLLDQTG